MEEDLVDDLLANAGLTAIVSNRITWAKRNPKKGLPALVMHRITPGAAYTYAGKDSLTGSLIQFDSWGTTFTEAKDLSRALEAALATLEPPLRAAFIEGGGDDFEDGDGPEGSGPTTLFRSRLDARVWHSA